MGDVIGPVILGIIISILGISNMKEIFPLFIGIIVSGFHRMM